MGAPDPSAKRKFWMILHRDQDSYTANILQVFYLLVLFFPFARIMKFSILQ